MLRDFVWTTWIILRKDLRIWLRQPTNMAATLIPPLSFMLVMALGAAAVGRSPVALVVQDPGPQGVQIAQAIEAADVFRLHKVDAAQAQVLLQNLDVVAVITIPPDFTRRAQAGETAPVEVLVNNLNLDFTNDIRRAVPDAITQYYLAQGTASPIQITLHEHDLRTRDVELFQYSILPIVAMLLLIGGLVTGGMAAAREWESRTIKELLVSPASNGAIIAGKVLASFTTTFLLGVLVLGLGNGLGWIQPEGVYWLTTLLVVALVSLVGAGLGVAVGAALQRIQPVIPIAVNLALYLFFLSGGITVLAFEPTWLQAIAAYDPLTYGIHALQMAIFYGSADQLGRDIAILGLSALAALGLGIVALRRRMAS